MKDENQKPVEVVSVSLDIDKLNKLPIYEGKTGRWINIVVSKFEESNSDQEWSAREFLPKDRKGETAIKLGYGKTLYRKVAAMPPQETHEKDARNFTNNFLSKWLS